MLKVKCSVDSARRRLQLVMRIIVRKSFSGWIDFLYGPLFRVMGFFYRVFTANRTRIANLKANKMISAGIKYLAMLILVGWILIWFFASDESRSRLSDEIRQTIGGFGSASDQ